VHIVTCAATVQGKAAPRDLIDALARLQEHPLVDVIVVARGGGSVQDLVAFDDEGLCRAIFACEKPIVTAIGHTDNVPVCNHVAWAAFTPSRSAEMVVPSADELRERVAAASRALHGLVDRLERSAERLHAAQAALASIARRMPSYEKVALAAAPLEARAQTYFRDLRQAVEEEQRRIGQCETVLSGVGDHVAELCRRLEVGTRRQLADHLRDYGNALARLVRETGAGVNRRLADSRRRYRHLADVIEARDFRRRGWAMATREDGAAVTTVEGLRSGSLLRLTFSDGAADAHVDRVLPDGEETE
jgi:exodeoxyribonuclease VII large subunit